jgi:phage protein D/phage baseplate assembly protein gpV
VAAAQGGTGVQSPTIKVDGKELDAPTMADLLDLRVALSVHSAGMTQLRFEDATFVILDKDTFKVGGTLSVSLPTAKNQAVAVFDGDIVAVGVDQGVGGRHELVVTAYDKAHKLSAQTTQKAYLNQAKGDVVKAIASRNGLSATCDPTGAAEPYLLQTGTDYAFLCELAASLGFEWFVDGKKLLFRKRPSTKGTKLTWGEDLLRFQARYSAADAALTDLTVRGWDPAQQKAVTGSAKSILGTPSGQDLGSDAPLAADAHKKAKGTFGKAMVVGSPSVRTAAEAQALATALARDLLGDAVTARGEAVGNPDLKPGTLVTVANMGKKLSGGYYVTEVEHVFGVHRPLVTRFTVSGHKPSGLGAGLSATTDVAHASWGQTGIVVGVVTNTKDPDKQGKVKVKFPTLGDAVESTWARIVMPGAGATRGMQIVPEVGDEVVVAFDRGDLRQAVVLGGLWSAKQKPPLADAVASDGSIQKRTIQTRAGHVIEMSDGKKGTAAGNAQRYVKIALGDKKTKVHVGEDKIDIEAAQGKPINIKAGKAEIKLSGTGDIILKGVNVTIEGSAKVAIKAPNVEIKAQAAVKIECSAQAEMKGAMVKIEGSGMTQVKGAMLKLN